MISGNAFLHEKQKHWLTFKARFMLWQELVEDDITFTYSGQALCWTATQSLLLRRVAPTAGVRIAVKSAVNVNTERESGDRLTSEFFWGKKCNCLQLTISAKTV